MTPQWAQHGTPLGSMYSASPLRSSRTDLDKPAGQVTRKTLAAPDPHSPRPPHPQTSTGLQFLQRSAREGGRHLQLMRTHASQEVAWHGDSPHSCTAASSTCSPDPRGGECSLLSAARCRCLQVAFHGPHASPKRELGGLVLQCLSATTAAFSLTPSDLPTLAAPLDIAVTGLTAPAGAPVPDSLALGALLGILQGLYDTSLPPFRVYVSTALQRHVVRLFVARAAQWIGRAEVAAAFFRLLTHVVCDADAAPRLAEDLANAGALSCALCAQQAPRAPLPPANRFVAAVLRHTLGLAAVELAAWEAVLAAVPKDSAGLAEALREMPAVPDALRQRVVVDVLYQGVCRSAEPFRIWCDVAPEVLRIPVACAHENSTK